ncbi:Intracellular viral protein [Monkeypox virus]
MRSLIIVLLFPSIIYSMSIRRCEKTEEETWGLKIGLCIIAKDFYPERTDCSVHRPTASGGLITEGNGFRVVIYDQCTEPHDFIITDTQQTRLGSSHTYIKFSNMNTGVPSSIPKCSKTLCISVYCDQEAGDIKFEEYTQESSDISIRVKYDSSCIDYLGINQSFMNECIRRITTWDRESCVRIDTQTINKYLKSCTNTKFDRNVYKRYILKSKALHAKTEL